MLRSLPWISLALVALVLPTTEAAELVLLPPSATLAGPKAAQRFLVEARDGGAFVADRTGPASFAIDNPRIATVSADGTVTPAGDGSARLTATVGGQTAQATITVKGFGSDAPWSFRNHV